MYIPEVNKNIMLHVFSFLIAPRCGPLPYVVNATVEMNYTSDFESFAFVKCWTGYRFTDLEKTKHLECKADQTWDFYGHCYREYIQALDY